VIGVASAVSAGALTNEQVRARVDHHVRQAADLVTHFEALVNADCQRFADADAWNAYLDTEADRMALLAAHLDQAWIEAKRSPDDDIRRAAKAPRRQAPEARQLVDKLTACATLNGTTFSPLDVFRRLQVEVPRRRAEIVLPE